MTDVHDRSRARTRAAGTSSTPAVPNIDERLPAGFRVTLDADAKQLRPDMWFGGSPSRVLRLTSAGIAAWAQLRAGAVHDPVTGRLARRLTDAGIAHPVPPPARRPLDVTVLVPVFDRPDALDRCLRALGREHPVVVVDDGSRDAPAIEHVVRCHGARLVRRSVNGGPAAARNAGLATIDTEFVAFVDSDCVPPAGWLESLAGHLADPLVAAAAPRVTATVAASARGRGGWVGRYAVARGGLDLGDRPGRVAAGNRVSYVPTAALLARRSALTSVARGDYVFDPALRFGEDVDLVWRLGEAGWRIRYDPSVEVRHEEPGRWAQLLRRRFRYGTSAAPLGRTHPDSIAPLVLHPGATATVVALLARRPVLAGLAFAWTVRGTASTLRDADVPSHDTVQAMAGAVRQTWLGLGRYGTQFAAPALAAAAVVPGRPGRRLAALSLLLGPSVTAWIERRGKLDPGRFVAAHVADEIAYGAGVWAGCLRRRTLTPVRPVVVRPARPRATATSVRRSDQGDRP